MSRQIVVPGSELEELRDLLRRVAGFVDDQTKVDVIEDAVGPPLREAAQDFEDRWSDGRYQLHKQCSDLAAAINTILDTFVRTDDKLAEPLTQQA